MVDSKSIAVIGAGINGLVAANYLLRAGHRVTLLENKERVGGACVSETAEIDGQKQDYALGASTLGLMQDFVWQETGLADRLVAKAVTHADLVYYPGDDHPTFMYNDVDALSRELSNRWGEKGDLAAYRSDGDRVVRFLQEGYRAGRPPSVSDANAALGADLTSLWITGSAAALLDHYMTADKTKLVDSMMVNESGPTSLYEPYSAYNIPMMSSGSVFDGYYGYVRGGIWQICRELAQINKELGMELVLSAQVQEADLNAGTIRYETTSGDHLISVDHVIFATDPKTAARISGASDLIDKAGQERDIGTSGKLNLMFKNPIKWRVGTCGPETDSAFRYIMAVETIDEFEAATLGVANGDADFAPGYFHIYSEGPAMRLMGMKEPYERLAVFFKNLGLEKTGEELAAVEAEVKSIILNYVCNPEDCVWTRLLTPKDLQETFGFPGGNLDHTELVGDQNYDGRHYSGNGSKRFYQFGTFDNASICGSSTYPCGSVAGTPAYMCVSELLRDWA